MQKLEDSLREKQEKLAALQKLLPQLKKGKQSSDSKMPKTEEQCLAAIDKEKKRVAADEFKLEEKREGKNLSLGTSKINYMDPRITISWCKNNEVPIEKLFTKPLMGKFAWAMDNDPNWRF